MMRGEPLLRRALELSLEYLRSLDARPVGARASREELLAALGGAFSDAGADPLRALEELARGADRGLVASAGPRYFGFVVGGTLPAALAADWLVSAWDQNAGLNALSPASAAIEEIAAGWLIDLFGLPKGSSCGFVTGGQGANFTCLMAARHEVYRRAGWDVEKDGLFGAPPLRVIAGAEAHVSIYSALRMLGIGAGHVEIVPADAQDRMIPAELEKRLGGGGPAIVLAQAGNVNTGAFDPLVEIEQIAHRHGAWVHVDGAFGLWAAASPRLRKLTAGIERCDSWGTDAHKWLNAPYDCGVAMTAHPAAHRAACSATAAYFVMGDKAERDPFEWVPESSRRARATPVYLALRTLGRRGVADLIEGSCALAGRMASGLRAGGAEILNEVVLNQVLVRFGERTDEVIDRVQRDGVLWLGGTTWQGRRAMRISVSGWNTTEADVDRSIDAILSAAR
jgi:glutamate/tyrosine decarboxylase-like PLP-dependent enzyme